MTSVFGGAQTVPQSTNQAFSQQQQQATQTDTTQNQTANQNVRSTTESNTLSQNLAGDIFNAAHNIYQGGQVPGLNVAPLTPEQYAAIGGMTSGGMGIGSSLIPTGTNFLTSGAGMMSGAGAPLTAEDVAAFYNPMASNVSANLQDIFGQQNLANRLGATTAAGGVGGDRAAVAQGILAQKQGLAAGQVYTDLYQKALQAAQQQKVQQLGAGAGVAGLGLPTIGAGVGGYQTALQGASVPQAQQQAVNTALYQQMMGQYQDPFMRLQAIAAPLPAFTGMGGTTTTTGQTTQQGVGQTIGAANQQSTGLNVGQGQITYPAPSMFSQLAGLGVAGLGAASLFRKQGGRVNPRRFQSGGGIDIGGSIAGPSPSVASAGPSAAGADSITIDDSQVPLYRWIDLGTPRRTFQYGGEVGDDSGDGGDDSSYVGGSDDYYGEDEGQESKDKLYQELTQRQEQAQTAKKPWQRAQKTLSAINTMQKGLKGFEANTNLKGPTFPPVPWQSMSPIRAGNFQGGGVVAPRGLPMPRANAPSLGNYPQVLGYPALFAAARNAMRPMPRGYPAIRAPIAQPVPVASAPVATAPVAPTPVAPTAPAVSAPVPAATPAVTSMYSPVLKQSPIPNGTYVPSPPLSSEFLQQASTPATEVPEQRETMASPVLQQSPIPSQEGGRVTPSTASEWEPGETERHSYQQSIGRAAATGPERWDKATGRYISAAPGRYYVGPTPSAIVQANRTSGVVNRWEPAPGVYQGGGRIQARPGDLVQLPQQQTEDPQEPETPEPTPATSEEELRAQPAGPTPPPPAPAPDVAGMPRVGGGIGGMFSGLFGGKGGGTGEERPSPALALMQAGLGMLAASGQRDARGLPMSPLGAIGLGGMAGIQTYQGQQQQILKDRQRALQEKNINDLIRHRQALEAHQTAMESMPKLVGQGRYGPIYINPKTGQTYVDEQGRPITPPMTGTVPASGSATPTPAAPAEPSALPVITESGAELSPDEIAPPKDPEVAPVAERLTKDDLVSTKANQAFLATLDPRDAAVVKAIAEGRQPISSLSRFAPAYRQRIMEDVNTYDPSYSASRVKLRDSFLGGSRTGNGSTVQSFDMTMQHVGRMLTSGEKLRNYNVAPQYLNKGANWFKENFGWGDKEFGEFQAAKSAFIKDRDAVASELMRATRGVGSGSLEEIRHWREGIDVNSSPIMIRAAAQEALKLLNGRVNALGKQWNDGMGTNKDPLSWLSKDARNMYNAVENLDPKKPLKFGPDGMPYQGERGAIAPAPSTAAPIRKINREKAKAAGWSDTEIDAYEKGQ